MLMAELIMGCCQTQVNLEQFRMLHILLDDILGRNLPNTKLKMGLI
jgi:hypothetical protein